MMPPPYRIVCTRRGSYWTHDPVLLVRPTIIRLCGYVDTVTVFGPVFSFLDYFQHSQTLGLVLAWRVPICGYDPNARNCPGCYLRMNTMLTPEQLTEAYERIRSQSQAYARWLEIEMLCRYPYFPDALEGRRLRRRMLRKAARKRIQRQLRSIALA